MLEAAIAAMLFLAFTLGRQWERMRLYQFAARIRELDVENTL